MLATLTYTLAEYVACSPHLHEQIVEAMLWLADEGHRIQVIETKDIPKSHPLQHGWLLK